MRWQGPHEQILMRPSDGPMADRWRTGIPFAMPTIADVAERLAAIYWLALERAEPTREASLDALFAGVADLDTLAEGASPRERAEAAQRPPSLGVPSRGSYHGG